MIGPGAHDRIGSGVSAADVQVDGAATERRDGLAEIVAQTGWRAG